MERIDRLAGIYERKFGFRPKKKSNDVSKEKEISKNMFKLWDDL